MTLIERVTEPEVILAAPHLFDGPPLRDATQTFLDAPGHHILMAFDDDGGRGQEEENRRRSENALHGLRHQQGQTDRRVDAPQERDAGPRPV